MSLNERFSALRNWRAHLVGELTGDILEIGIGTGPSLAHYHMATRVWAIEPGLERARLARQAGAAAGLDMAVQVAPAESLPHADNSFDHVVSSLVFCSVSDQRLALDEIRRVLRPSGTLHMVEHVRPRNRWLATVVSTVTPGWRRIAMNCHLDRPTLDHLRENGWTVQVHERFGIFVRLSAT